MTTLIAQLPMYLQPHNRAAHDQLWLLIRDGLRRRGIAAPDGLDTQHAHDALWRHSDLCLTQICNLPLRLGVRGAVTAIGACDYGLDGCAPGYYRSLFVVRTNHPAQTAAALDGLTMAYNDPLSHSGWGAPWLWAQHRGVRFVPTLCTGAHLESVRAVVAGRVDFACIDAQSLRSFAGAPVLRHVRVIDATEVSPGQTICTRAGQDPLPYFEAINEAIAWLPAKHRQTLGLRQILRLPPDAYDLRVPPMPHDVS